MSGRRARRLRHAENGLLSPDEKQELREAVRGVAEARAAAVVKAREKRDAAIRQANAAFVSDQAVAWHTYRLRRNEAVERAERVARKRLAA